MKIISVVRNFKMYDDLVKNNSFYPKDTKFICFDNNKENFGISKRYNSFLKEYDYKQEDWFVFCHEDWELKEDLKSRLSNISKDYIYGVTGTETNWNILKKYHKPHRIVGQIENSHKDGSDCQKCGVYNDQLVDVGTVDCQCLIVHSSLIKKYNLTFDENLLFDLYTEDFCINARENFNISTKIIQLKCQHYSYGNLGDNFRNSYKYLQQKYKNAKNTYTTTCVDKQVIGNRFFKYLLKIYKLFLTISSIVYQRKYQNCKEIIKIFRIVVYRDKERFYDKQKK